mgnify:CR=1 FL=1
MLTTASEWVDLLGSSAGSDARRALTAMGGDAVEALIAGLDHEDSRVRVHSAGLMDQLGDERCLKALEKALDDPIADVRRRALHSIACDHCKETPLDVDRVALTIRHALGDPSIRVRRVATHQLGNLPSDPRSVDALRRLVQDVDTKVRARAQWSLQQVEPAR